VWIYLSTRNAYANKGLLDNANKPKPVVSELSPDLRTILRSHVAEFALRSSSFMFVANRETENRHVVMRSPLDAFNIKNYRTFTHAEIVDMNAAATLLRDDMPTITGSRKTVWPSLCAAMHAWSETLVMDRAEILHIERTSWRRHEEFYKQSLLGICEGPATNSGHRNPPRHIPDFEKNRLSYLRPDLTHSWLFPAHS